MQRLDSEREVTHQLRLNPKWLLALPFLLLLFPLRFPNVIIDEMWHIDTAWTFSQTGKLAIRAWGNYYGLDQVNFQPPVFNLILGIWFKIIGAGVFQARLLMVLLSAIYLWTTYRIAERLYGPTTAVLGTVFLFGWCFQFFRTVRYDILVGAFFLLGLYYFLKSLNSDRNLLFAASSGGFCALAGLSHYFGIFSLPAIGILFLFQYRSNVFREKSLWSFILGASIPLLLYSIYYFANYSILQAQLEMFHSARISILSPSFYAWNVLNEWVRWFPLPVAELFLFFMGSFVFFLFFARKKSSEDRVLSVVILTFLVGFSLFIRNKTTIYLMPVFPFLSIGAAIFWMNVHQWSWELAGKRFFIRQSINALFMVAFVVAILIRPAHALYTIFYKYDFQETDYTALLRDLRGAVPRDAVIAGTYAYWPAFIGQTFYDENLLFRLKKIDGQTFGTAVEKLNIDYLIYDKAFEYYQADPELKGYLEREFIPVSVIANNYYGNFPGVGSEDDGAIHILRKK